MTAVSARDISLARSATCESTLSAGSPDSRSWVILPVADNNSRRFPSS